MTSNDCRHQNRTNHLSKQLFVIMTEQKPRLTSDETVTEHQLVQRIDVGGRNERNGRYHTSDYRDHAKVDAVQ